MITVNFKKTNRDIVMTIKGHAGQAAKGQDIICAAASILAYTTAQTVTQFHKQGWLLEKPRISLQDGVGSVWIKPKAEYVNECAMAFFVIENGYFLLEKNFSKYVRVNLFGKLDNE